MASNTRTNREDAAEQVSGVVVRDLQEVGEATKRMATDSVDVLRDAANQYLDEGRAKVRELGDSIHSKVQHQPMKSLLIATGIGFLLGVLWRRR